MDKFKGLAEILKEFSDGMEKWKECELDEVTDAKATYQKGILPKKLEEIEKIYAKRYTTIRSIAASKLEMEVRAVKKRNQGKFLPNHVDLVLLNELNAINMSGVSLTESEIEDYCKRAFASRSSFCVRAVQELARKSGMRLDTPTEDLAVKIIDKANNRLKKIIETYDGKFAFGDRSKDQSIIMDAHGFADNGFLARLEQEYQKSTLEDIRISEIDRKKYAVQQAKERDEKKKEPVEVVEVGKDIGVTAKSKSTPASQFAREYSSQMQQSGFNVNPEFE